MESGGSVSRSCFAGGSASAAGGLTDSIAAFAAFTSASASSFFPASPWRSAIEART